MIVCSENLVHCLREIAPTKIAVAYVGKGWGNFVDAHKLETVVLSPTVGSNPAAIATLAEKLGWENVWFLEELHSKLYIGAEAVLIGSANLSRNAFGDCSREEACVQMDSVTELREARALFDRYLAKAKQRFPDKAAKLSRLDQLWREHRAALVHGRNVEEEGQADTSFANYSPQRNGRFYVCWYINVPYQYTPEVPDAIRPDIESEFNFAPDDIDPQHQWILTWLRTGAGTIHRRAKLSWVYVHETFRNGVDDEGYETLGVQRRSLYIPPKPFDEADPAFVRAFQSVIERPEFERLRGMSDETWRVKDYVNMTEQLILEIQKEYRK